MPVNENALRVLIADDDDEFRLLLQKALEQHGFRVDAVSNGESAIQTWEQARQMSSPFCAVLLDAAMPDKTGYEVTAHIRKIQRNTAPTPVLIMTGTVEPIAAGHATYVKADDLIIKPFAIDEIVARLRQLCEVKKTVDRIAERLENRDMAPDEVVETRQYLSSLVTTRSLSRTRRAQALGLLAAMRTS